MDKQEAQVSLRPKAEPRTLPLDLGHIEHDFTMGGVERKREHVRRCIFGSVCAIERSAACVAHERD